MRVIQDSSSRQLEASNDGSIISTDRVSRDSHAENHAKRGSLCGPIGEFGKTLGAVFNHSSALNHVRDSLGIAL